MTLELSTSYWIFELIFDNMRDGTNALQHSKLGSLDKVWTTNATDTRISRQHL